MAVRTKRLFGPMNVAVSGTGVYVCPADETAIIKLISLSNVSAALTDVPVVYLGGTTPANIIWLPGPVSPLRTAILSEFVVLQPGQQLIIASSNPNTITAYGAGAELEGIAD